MEVAGQEQGEARWAGPAGGVWACTAEAWSRALRGKEGVGANQHPRPLEWGAGSRVRVQCSERWGGGWAEKKAQTNQNSNNKNNRAGPSAEETQPRRLQGRSRPQWSRGPGCGPSCLRRRSRLQREVRDSSVGLPVHQALRQLSEETRGAGAGRQGGKQELREGPLWWGGGARLGDIYVPPSIPPSQKVGRPPCQKSTKA